MRRTHQSPELYHTVHRKRQHCRHEANTPAWWSRQFVVLVTRKPPLLPGNFVRSWVLRGRPTQPSDAMNVCRNYRAFVLEKLLRLSLGHVLRRTHKWGDVHTTDVMRVGRQPTREARALACQIPQALSKRKSPCMRDDVFAVGYEQPPPVNNAARYYWTLTNSCTSSSFVKRPFPPISVNGLSRIMSPEVLIT